MDIEAEINELKSRVTALSDRVWQLELDAKAKNTPAEPAPAQPAPVVEMPAPVTPPAAG